MAHCRGAEARYRKPICEAVSDELLLEGVAERLCRLIHGLAGKKLVMHQTLRVKESAQSAGLCVDHRRWTCGHF
jgi:hypothetical protein